MERRAKERLIGASILVLVLVLVVPELLSGPKPAAPPAPTPLLPRPGSGGAPEPVRTVTVDLATRKPAVLGTEERAPAGVAETAARAASAASAADAASDVGTDAASAAGAASPASEPTPPQPPPTDSLETGTPPPTSAHAWAVQLGSFANRRNADNLMHQLKSQGFQVYDSAAGFGTAQRFRVRIGPLADRGSAERAIAKLKALGHPATLVTPGH